MLNILKVLLSLAGEHKLKLSMTQIEHLTAQLIMALIIGMFLTTLAAIALAAGSFGLYQLLITNGIDAIMSAIAVAFVLVVSIGLCLARLSYYTRSIRSGLKTVARFETPIVGPVVGQVSNVAQSFISGLMHPTPKSTKPAKTTVEAASAPEKPHIALVRTRSL